MTDYRVYVISGDGHFVRAIQLDRADNNAAIESAKQFVNGHGIELWQHERIVAKLDLPAQPVDATQALNPSAGVSNCKVSRGRSFS